MLEADGAVTRCALRRLGGLGGAAAPGGASGSGGRYHGEGGFLSPSLLRSKGGKEVSARGMFRSGNGGDDAEGEKEVDRSEGVTLCGGPGGKGLRWSVTLNKGS